MSKVTEGFCKHLKVTSEMLNGEVIIDGWFRVDLGIGDFYTMETGPEFNLSCMRLENLWDEKQVLGEGN